MIYVVLPFGEEPEGLQKTIREIDPGAYTDYAPKAYFLAFSGTAKTLSDRLKFTVENDAECKDGMVAALGDNHGYANADFWDWVTQQTK